MKIMEKNRIKHTGPCPRCQGYGYLLADNPQAEEKVPCPDCHEEEYTVFMKEYGHHYRS